MDADTASARVVFQTHAKPIMSDGRHHSDCFFIYVTILLLRHFLSLERRDEDVIERPTQHPARLALQIVHGISYLGSRHAISLQKVTALAPVTVRYDFVQTIYLVVQWSYDIPDETMTDLSTQAVWRIESLESPHPWI